MDSSIVLLATISYVAGGIPTGYLIARQLRGIDIRQFGSGNPGAANVYRIVGKGAGVATLAVERSERVLAGNLGSALLSARLPALGCLRSAGDPGPCLDHFPAV